MGVFDYLVGDESGIRRGSLVTVPWRNRGVVGLVVGTEDRSDIPPKRLKAVTGKFSANRLPEDAVRAMEWAANRYLASPGTIVRCFIPTPPKRRPTPVPTDTADAGEKGPDSRPQKSTGRIFVYGSPEEKRAVMSAAVGKCLESGKSAIVLAPHREDIRETVAVLADSANGGLAEIHGQLPAGILWANWERCLNGQATVAVGSRMAVMAPINRLGLIVILEGDSPDHKQYDQNPRYDARALAKVRTDTAGAELLIMTQSLRVEEIVMARNGFRLENGSVRPAPVVLADISSWGKEWSGPLAPASVDRIVGSLQDGKNALIYHDRQGTAGALACADCRQVSRCPKCSLAMPIRRETLYCPRCGQAVPLPTACPTCGGNRLRTIGWGTAAVESFLKKTIPGTSVQRIDAETGRVGSGQNARVLIGSRGLVHDLSELHGGNFGTVIVTAAEDLLRRPGFRTTEEAWGLIQKLRYLAARSQADLVIQTLNTEDPKVRSLAEDAKTFLDRELAMRRETSYPPAGRLVLVVSRGQTEREATSRSEWVRRRLLPACRANGPKTVLSQPFRPSRPVRNGQWRQAIAIKTPEIGPGLDRALRSLPEEHSIEPDPETPI